MLCLAVPQFKNHIYAHVSYMYTHMVIDNEDYTISLQHSFKNDTASVLVFKKVEMAGF